MVIIIISIAVAAFFLLSEAIGEIMNFDDNHINGAKLMLVICSLICAVELVVAADASIFTTAEYVHKQHEKKAAELNDRRELLEKHASDSKYKYRVKEYNADVVKYQTHILDEQKGYKNAWTSWFHSKHYLDLDINDVSTITYTGE